MVEMDDRTLHDAVLQRIEVDWETGTVVLMLSLVGYIPVELRCTQLISLVAPRRAPWGESPSINAIAGPEPVGDHHRIAIEMQSGDVIVLEAASFEILEV
jgi:hypothetical protein